MLFDNLTRPCLFLSRPIIFSTLPALAAGQTPLQKPVTTEARPGQCRGEHHLPPNFGKLPAGDIAGHFYCERPLGLKLITVYDVSGSKGGS